MTYKMTIFQGFSDVCDITESQCADLSIYDIYPIDAAAPTVHNNNSVASF